MMKPNELRHLYRLLGEFKYGLTDQFSDGFQLPDQAAERYDPFPEIVFLKQVIIFDRIVKLQQSHG